jgi:hypothetical protein
MSESILFPQFLHELADAIDGGLYVFHGIQMAQ